MPLFYALQSSNDGTDLDLLMQRLMKRKDVIAMMILQAAVAVVDQGRACSS